MSSGMIIRKAIYRAREIMRAGRAMSGYGWATAGNSARNPRRPQAIVVRKWILTSRGPRYSAARARETADADIQHEFLNDDSAGDKELTNRGRTIPICNEMQRSCRSAAAWRLHVRCWELSFSSRIRSRPAICCSFPSPPIQP